MARQQLIDKIDELRENLTHINLLQNVSKEFNTKHPELAAVLEEEQEKLFEGDPKFKDEWIVDLHNEFNSQIESSRQTKARLRQLREDFKVAKAALAQKIGQLPSDTKGEEPESEVQ